MSSIPFGILKSIQFMIFHVAMIFSSLFPTTISALGVAFPFLLFGFLLQVIVYYYFTLYYLYRIIPSPWPGGLDWSSSIGVAFLYRTRRCAGMDGPFLLYHPGEPYSFLPSTFTMLLWSCVLISGHY